MQHERTPIADALRAGRAAAAMSQGDLAEASGVAQRTISDIERGLVRRPHPHTLRQLAAALPALGASLGMAAPDAPAAGDLPEARPAPPAPLGRAREAALALRLLDEGARLLTLTGPAGGGKTFLAEHVLRAAAGPRRCAIVRGHAVAADDLLPAVAAALGVREPRGDRSWMDLVRDDLAETPTLLLLDGPERLPGAAAAIGGLLAACPGLTVLAASRQPLGLEEERLIVVRPLPCPEPGAATPEAVLAAPAGELFVAMARRRSPAFALDAANAAAVAEICRRVDGLPLALDLVAGQMAFFSPSAVLGMMAEAGLSPFSWDGQAGGTPFATMDEAVAWTYDLLSAEEQLLFRALGACAGGFDPDTARALFAALGGAPTEAMPALASLARRHLVQEAGPPGLPEGPRFAMLHSLAGYALQLARARGEEPALRAAHAAHVALRLDRIEYGIYTPEQARWLDQFAADRDNALAALAWSTAPGGERWIAHKLIANLGSFWEARGHYREARGGIAAALAVPPDQPTIDWFWTVYWASVFAIMQNDYVGSLRHAERLYEIGTALGEPEAVLLGLARRVRALHELDREGPETHALAEEALAIGRGLPPSLPVAAAIALMGIERHLAGDLVDAERYARESLEMRLALGAENYAAASRSLLAAALTGLGRWQEGLTEATLAVSGSADAGDPWERVKGLIAAAHALAAGPLPPEDAERVGALLGAAEAEIARNEIGLWRFWVDHRREAGDRAAARIGPAPFEEARARGRELSPAAVLEALAAAG